MSYPYMLTLRLTEVGVISVVPIVILVSAGAIATHATQVQLEYGGHAGPSAIQRHHLKWLHHTTRNSCVRHITNDRAAAGVIAWN